MIMSVNVMAKNYLETLCNLSDEEIILTEATLNLGFLYRTNINLEAYRRHIYLLKADVKNYLHGLTGTPNLNFQQESIAYVLFQKYGYISTSDTVNSYENSNLTCVIDNRIGIPIMLGILYLILAWGQGWHAVGLGFPSRFLIRLEHNGERVIVDPCFGGQTLSSPTLRQMLKLDYRNQ